MHADRSRNPSRGRGLARSLRVNPATHEIRLALAASTAMLALAGSGVADAACSFTDPTTVTCTAGPYNAGLPGGSFVPVVDLTLVLDPGVTIDPASGVVGVSASWGGDVSVITSADITTLYADAVFMYGSTSATLVNAGTIYAYVDSDNAVDINSNGNVDLDNSGLIQAEAAAGYVATAVDAFSGYGDILIQNSGTISANSDTQSSNALIAYAAYGDLTIDNSGTISATSQAYSADAVEVRAKYDVTVNNSGSIYASTSTFYFNNAVFVTAGGDAAAGNSGTIYAYSFGSAGGILLNTVFGEASATNSGSIEAVSAYGRAGGMGMYGDSADADNSGTIAVAGYDTSRGIYAVVDYDAAVSNSGVVAVDADGAYIGHYAYGIFAYSQYGTVDVQNSGTVSATSTNSAGGNPIALGIYAHAAADNVDISNSGYVSAVAASVSNNPFASGIEAYSYGGDASVSNSGTIHASATAAPYTGLTSYGVYVHSYLGDANLTNSGIISATANGGIPRAVRMTTIAGDITVVNSAAGEITASNDSYAVAISAYSTAGGISIDNAGLVSATGVSGDAYAIFAYTFGDDGEIALVNSGAIYAASDAAAAFGAKLLTFGDGADITLDISASTLVEVIGGNSTGYSLYTDMSAGVQARAYGVGSEVHVANAGTIEVRDYIAFGLIARSPDFASGSNSGEILVLAEESAFGMRVRGDTGAYALNSGVISLIIEDDLAATPSVPQGNGLSVRSVNGDVYVGNSGTISVSVFGEGSMEANAVGMDADSNVGDILMVNSGLVQAQIYVGANDAGYFSSDAVATSLQPFYGLGTFVNSGTIEAYAEFGQAFGFIGLGLGTFDITNAGTISATAGDGDSYGHGSYGVLVRNAQGLVSVTNSGEILAFADGGPEAIAEAVKVRYYPSSAYADALIVNDGDILAAAHGDYTVEALAIHAMARYVDIGTGAGSHTSATASGDPGALAIAVSVDAGLAASIANAGDISALAADGDAYGVYAVVRGAGDLAIDNTGDIASAAAGYAHGIRATAYGTGNVDIHVAATGSVDVHSGSDAIGVSVDAYGGGTTSIDNQGEIYVYSANGDAFGIVSSYGTGDFHIHNSGTIAAAAPAGSAYAIHAYTLPGAPVTIDNDGTLSGAIVTGSGDDIFVNTSTGAWNATGSSYFGAGDDAIFNSGTINLQGATIDLGIDPAGNQFVNDNLITVSGSNIIDMGTGTDLVTPNPYPFQNNGLIDFQDGAPDDSLTIIGDLAGDGDINLDVSGLHGTSDLMYIDGNVDPDSVSTINIDLLDFPAGDFIDAPMVVVGGISAPDNFVLGEVSYEPGLLDFQFALVTTTNSSGLDAYALRFAPELSDTGDLASLITPGVSMLMRDVVGTTEQRQASSQLIEGQGRLSMWARVFYNEGWVEPNGGASFDMRTGGGETGLNFAASDRFGAGLILGRSELKQRLREGIGSDAIKGNVYGGYGNMALPGGFSLDLSHRRLKFDAEIDSSGASLSSGGEADTSNLEAGFRWMSKKNFGIQLQFQQTITRISSLDTISGPIPFEGDNGRYSLTRLGGEMRKTWEPTPKGTIWVGRVLFNAIREFDGTSRYNVGDTLTGKTSLEGTSFRLEAGASAQRGSFLIYGSLTYEDGGVLHNFFGAHMGGRWVW